VNDPTEAQKEWQKAARKAKREHLELTLLQGIRGDSLPEPEREYRFHDSRKWRFDFAWPDQMLAVEIEGGQWIRGRHNRPKGLEQDAEKYNAAMIDGWTVIRVTTSMVHDGRALDAVRAALQATEGGLNR
jgi:very-short-patch-repair endonuclease